MMLCKAHGVNVWKKWRIKKKDKMSVHKILKFKTTSGFGKWQKYFPEEAVAHPAKINLHLLNYLILNYTKEGDTVLDCMCGTGSTVVLSVLNNRNGIGVELEEKFTGWAKQAINNVEQQQTLMSKGKGIVICGDSRKLSEVLKEHKEEISSVLFSPPYGQVQKGGGIAIKGYEGKHGKDENLHLRHDRPLSEDERNISNLPTGDIDSVVFSPPYAQSTSPFVRGAPLENGAGLPTIRCLNIQDGYSQSMGNIGNLPFLAAILFSPPYSNIETSQQTSKSEIERRIEKGIQGAVITEEGKYMTGGGKRQEKYSTNLHNIGNIKEFGVDAVLTSPSYEKTVKDHGKSDRATKINVEKNNHSSFAYSSDKDNIGNQKKETYLEAMKTVYEQCFLVLKPQGLLILILKNFIQEKKVVPLTEHTVKLCESVGFKLKERLLFKLPTQSFWRRLYAQKYPEVDTVDLRFEHILIFEKV